MTICEIYIASHWNSIRSQIPWITETTDILGVILYGIPDCDYSVEKNIRPVKKDSKPPSGKKIPTASEIV